MYIVKDNRGSSTIVWVCLIMLVKAENLIENSLTLAAEPDSLFPNSALLAEEAPLPELGLPVGPPPVGELDPNELLCLRNALSGG